MVDRILLPTIVVTNKEPTEITSEDWGVQVAATTADVYFGY